MSSSDSEQMASALSLIITAFVVIVALTLLDRIADAIDAMHCPSCCEVQGQPQ
jgi:hypothetical protein